MILQQLLDQYKILTNTSLKEDLSFSVKLSTQALFPSNSTVRNKLIWPKAKEVKQKSQLWNRHLQSNDENTQEEYCYVKLVITLAKMPPIPETCGPVSAYCIIELINAIRFLVLLTKDY